MSLADRQEGLRTALHSIDDDMRGLNPKTSTYQKLAAKRGEIIKALEQVGAARTKDMPKL